MSQDSQAEPENSGARSESAERGNLKEIVDEVTTALILDGLIDKIKVDRILKSGKSSLYMLYELEELRPGFIELISTLTPGTKPVIVGRLLLISMVRVARQIGGDDLAQTVFEAADTGPNLPNLAALRMVDNSGKDFTNRVLRDVLRLAPDTAGVTLMSATKEVSQRLIDQGLLAEESVRSAKESNLADFDVLGRLETMYPGLTELLLDQLIADELAVSSSGGDAADMSLPKPRRGGLFRLGRRKRG